jgi:hypothetical protein
MAVGGTGVYGISRKKPGFGVRSLAVISICPTACVLRCQLFVFLREDPWCVLVTLEHMMAIGSAQRLRQLVERSTYGIAGDDRGRLAFSCGT